MLVARALESSSPRDASLARAPPSVSKQKRGRGEDADQPELAHDRGRRRQRAEGNEVDPEPPLHDTPDRGPGGEAEHGQRDRARQREILLPKQPDGADHGERELHPGRVVHPGRLRATLREDERGEHAQRDAALGQRLRVRRLDRGAGRELVHHVPQPRGELLFHRRPRAEHVRVLHGLVRDLTLRALHEAPHEDDVVRGLDHFQLLVLVPVPSRHLVLRLDHVLGRRVLAQA
mmetsp:Transcript_24455/g.57913  ORF Transcript_24455/g.57913 Transcript_24455/m.57913 type:complete len:233 (+) Transcript_24455:32-730(+)